jgi:hypothetical protein
MNENLDKHICERVYKNVIGQECKHCKKKFVQFDIVVTRWGNLYHERCDKPAELARRDKINKAYQANLGGEEEGHL